MVALKQITIENAGIKSGEVLDSLVITHVTPGQPECDNTASSPMECCPFTA
jgi:hypothetical protein